MDSTDFNTMNMASAASVHMNAFFHSKLVLEYDPNYNVSPMRTPRGPTVQVMFISGFVFVFDCS